VLYVYSIQVKMNYLIRAIFKEIVFVDVGKNLMVRKIELIYKLNGSIILKIFNETWDY